MSTYQSELEVMDLLVPELEAEGYEVFLQPRRQLLPQFLKGYKPDAIARRPDKSLVVEIVRQSEPPDPRIAEIASILKKQKDWDLKLVWVTPTGSRKEIDSPSPATIRKRTGEVRTLAEEGHFVSALQFPQTPARLTQVLSNHGFITPSEADKLRSLAQKRNKVAHGDFTLRVTKSDIENMLDTLTTTLRMFEKRPVNGKANVGDKR